MTENLTALQKAEGMARATGSTSATYDDGRGDVATWDASMESTLPATPAPVEPSDPAPRAALAWEPSPLNAATRHGKRERTTLAAVYYVGGDDSERRYRFELLLPAVGFRPRRDRWPSSEEAQAAAERYLARWVERMGF